MKVGIRMAIWKKLNTETGGYEEIPGTGGSYNCAVGGGSADESTGTLPDLTGKTAIFMGDSYTYAMSAMLKSMCNEIGLVADNRGVVSSTVCGNTSGSKGFAPMWSRTKDVCTEYTQAGTTDNVALIVFMGGANDGFGLETWVGAGITETSTDYIYGAMHSILYGFRQTFPAAKIITVLQPSNYSRSVDSVDSDETAAIFGFADLAALQVLDDYQYSNYAMYVKEKAVKDVAEFYGCAIVDCCFDWHSVLSADDRATYWNADKLHLSTAGYQDIVAKIKERMIEIL